MSLTKTTSTIMLLLFLTLLLPRAQTQKETLLLEEIIKTYQAITEANLKGANTTKLTEQLNQIIDESLNKKKPNTDTYTIVQQLVEIREQAAKIGEEAPNVIFWNNILIALTVILAASTVAGTYYLLFTKKKIWEIWLKLRRDNTIIVRKKKAKRSSMLLDEEVQAVLAAIIIVIIVFATTQYFLAGKVVEPFSELGLLGEKMKIGDYPTSLIEGE